ncbi:MAG TPA: DNA repair protein RecN [Nocardioidaceae bacterium]|nr:DNA repair protein RecN [Nocardioidaceae bacterium]
MLEELRLASLGVIDEAVLELGPGFTVITGETGAGKTMVVTALQLLLGARADSGLVRSGTDRARVEGRVRLGRSEALRARLAELDADVDDDSLILSRVLSAEGRSRAVIGGTAVPVGRLGEITDTLVAVHGQADQRRLLRPAHQREALDRYVGAPAVSLLERFGHCYSALRGAERSLAELVANVRERAGEAEMLRAGLAEIEAAEPVPGEDAALRAQEDRLAHADALRTAAHEARLALSGDDEGSGGDATARLDAVKRCLELVRDHDPQVAELADRVAELCYLAADVGHDVAAYAASIDADPGRLAWVQERRATLATLQRKYGDSADELLHWAAQAAKRVAELDSTDERIDTLRQTVAQLRGELTTLGAELSRLRVQAAERLTIAVSEELAVLAMPDARLVVSVRQRLDPAGLEVHGKRLGYGPHGLDDVELLLAGNLGSDPRPLDRVASGGELSRVMLGLEVVLAGRSPVPTLVFDEVDAGVGGKAAVEIGRRLALLARRAQVLAVTHLPQVAAFADRHYVVVKSSDGTITTSGLHDLDAQARVIELSRMLAGLEGSQAGRLHAAELLALAVEERSAHSG